MKKKVLFIIALVVAMLVILPLTVFAETKNNSLDSVLKNYLGTKEIKAPEVEEEKGKAYVEGTENNNGLLGGKQQNDERFVTITLHAGEHGYFGSQDKKTQESVQFIGGEFSDRTEPTIDDPSYIFLGWAKNENATSPDIKAGLVYGISVSSIGTDLYAVYSNKCTVFYQLKGNEYLEIGGQTYSMNDYYEEYTCGTKFNSYTPINRDGDLYSFVGWKDVHTDEEVTTDTTINKYEMYVESVWKFNLNELESIEVKDEPYQYTNTDKNKFYKFTPTETKVYEVYVKNVQRAGEELNSPKIAIYSENGKQMVLEGPSDDDSNAKAVYTFMKDTTYVIEIGEMRRLPLQFDYGIKVADYRTVTFHANRKTAGEAYFDGDTTKTTKQIPYSIGTEITIAPVGIMDNGKLNFRGWVLNPDDEYDPNGEKIIVKDNMDVYASFWELGSITLDANGGYFSGEGDPEVRDYVYIKGTEFDPAVYARCDDNHKKFAGWSKDKNATVPDEDILEEVTDADSLPRKLYAVYTDIILEKWDANGGYFMQDPEATTYYSSKGIGHIFYGMTLYNDNSNMIALGWYDQDGEYIPYTSEAYPYYRNKGDTTYTAVWGKKIILDANGGGFPNFGYASALYGVVECGKPFSLEMYADQIGRIAHDDATLYFAGWATTPDATEPNVIEGETSVDNLSRIYAVWKEDTYYFVDGEKATWTQGSEEGLTFTVKRKGDDYDTYSAFQKVSVDKNVLSSELYTRKEGSLILTLKPTYLETLSVGEHEVEIEFLGGPKVATSFIVAEKTEETGLLGGNEEKEKIEKQTKNEENSPQTGDKAIIVCINLIIIAIIGMAVTIKYF